MDLTLNNYKHQTNWINLLFKQNTTATSFELSEINHASLKEFISYLTKLNKDNIIDDKQFKDLLMIVCSNYIENEVEARISKKFSEKLFHFFYNLQ